MEYASNGKGNLGVTLGAIGTGLGILGGGSMLLGNNGGGYYMGNGYNNCGMRYDMELYNRIASKDSEIALLKSESNTEDKMIEVYKQVRSEIKELEKEVQANRREQDAWNASQSVANAQMSAAIATNNNSIECIKHLLNNITVTKVPNTAVCPGWGSVTVTPTTTAGTTFA